VADPIDEPIDAETADDSDQGGQQETERTITIAGLPILMTGIAAILVQGSVAARDSRSGPCPRRRWFDARRGVHPNVGYARR
jgi:hypothetical protein